MTKTLIAFSGKMTSGKTTLSELLVKRNGFKRYAIGDEIKSMANKLIENRSQLHKDLVSMSASQKVIENIIDLTQVVLEADYKKNYDGTYVKDKNYRELTQNIADIIRTGFGEDAWLNLFLERVNVEMEKGEKIVCDDVRVLDEYSKLTKQGFDFIRLEVDPNIQRERIIDMYGTINEGSLSHSTEIDLDEVDFKFTLDTSVDSIEQSYKKVSKFIKQ